MPHTGGRQTRSGVCGRHDSTDDDRGPACWFRSSTRRRHVERSVAAILGQRFDGELEVLLIDGGSDDRTPEIIERLAGEDRRVRVAVQPRIA